MIDFERNLTVKEVAEILGVSTKAVYEWCRHSPEAGGIPNSKYGRLVKIRESDLQKWMEERRRA